jgi:hypothetical protein
MVIVADRGAPATYTVQRELNNSVYLDANKQAKLAEAFPFIESLPWKHLSRKNVGYLYAILHGAQEVFDFDDDVVLITKKHHLATIPNPESSGAPPVISVSQPTAAYMHLVLNPFPLLGADSTYAWPRGFPIDRVKENSSSAAEPTPMATTDIHTHEIAIMQFIANNDPDTDAIYRLTQPLPFNFPIRGPVPVLVPRGVYAPYNSQATLHTHTALWSLLLPTTVHSSVSDIWRAYAAQRVLQYVTRGRLVYMPPIVAHYHEIHNHLADFASEEPLYTQALPLIHLLSQWQCSLPTLPGRIEALWVLLFERGYVAEGDVKLVQQWLGALVSIGYDFPPIE